MRKQLLATIKHENTANQLLSSRRWHEVILFAMLVFALLSFTPLLTAWGLSAGLSVVLGILIAPILAVACIRWPVLGLYLVAACAFVVEQEPLSTSIGTDLLYVFHWPTQMQGFIERPIGVLMFLALLIWLFPRLVKRQPLLQGGALIGPFAFYMLCVVGALIYGIMTGGDLKISVVQFRPFWYMFLAYIMAYNFVTHKSHIRHFLWLAIVSAGFKGLQGLYVYLIVYHGSLVGHETIMSHEESFFFAALLLLLFIFCFYYRYRPQLIAGLCVTPPVLISFVANQRRADYIALLVGISFVWVVIFLLKPKLRLILLLGMLLCSLLGTAYVLAFAQTQGALGSPARSIVSVFKPAADDRRNASSNRYRDTENYDLKYTARQHLLGLGFGRPFLQPKALEHLYPDVRASNPYYDYIPHNTIYWIWVDLGLVGFFAFWFLIGSIIVRGCFIARQLKDPYLQAIAIYVIGVTVMEVIVAFADYQLFFYRNVIDLGLLTGLLVKLPLLHQEQQENVGKWYTHQNLGRGENICRGQQKQF